MKDKILNGVQAATKAVATVGTGIGVFSIELLLLEKALPFHGAARLTAAISRAGRIIKIPTMTGGLTAMVGTSLLAGYAAGEAVDHLFDRIRGYSGAGPDKPRASVE